ncbi:MAG: pseudouridine synthase [Truepera sp.]|nr:pseudouridine synthase [Truepera sp.]
MSRERVQRFLARAGVSSRRKAEALISAGRVTVNGQVVQLGSTVVPGDEVRVSGRRVEARIEHVSFLLNKPAGVLCSVGDDRGRSTVMDFVPEVAGLHPVGRLDADSEGLLLLTTDGDLTFQLTHPSHGHPKTYHVWCAEGTVAWRTRIRLVEGVLIGGGLAVADAVAPLPGGCILTIHDGRNRQVRRMLAATGYTVVRLVRTQIGQLDLADLPIGRYRTLDGKDLEALGYTP